MKIKRDKPVVAVGVDGSAEAVEAIRYAAAVAAERDWDLLAVHAYQMPPMNPGFTAEIFDQLRAGANSVVDHAVAGLVIGADTHIHRLVTADPPVLALRAATHQADMLVLGRHHFSIGNQIVGRVGSAVAAKASCPVVIVPPGWSRASHVGRPVVVAVDGEQSAGPALSQGCIEAERRRTPLVAIHSVPLHGKRSTFTEEQASLAEIVAGVKQDHPDLEVKTQLRVGDPRTTILQETIVAGLVVVGHPHHRHGFGSWSSSLARALMDSSHCPLLIAPAAAPSRPLRSPRRRAGSEEHAAAGPMG